MDQFADWMDIASLCRKCLLQFDNGGYEGDGEAEDDDSDDDEVVWAGVGSGGVQQPAGAVNGGAQQPGGAVNGGAQQPAGAVNGGVQQPAEDPGTDQTGDNVITDAE